MSKHTEGPWMAAASPSSVVGWPVVGKGGRAIASVHCAMTKHADVSDERWQAYRAEVKANADLIGAAPDLFDACNAMLGLLQLVCGRDDVPAHIRELLLHNHRVDEVTSAIAKAEGRS